MPILAPETSLFPDNLLLNLTQQRPESRWWAVHTKARQEKSLARQLVGLDVPFYLPLIPRVANFGGRRIKSLLPLFSGYLFVYASDDQRISTLATDRVVHMWSAPDAAELTHDLQAVQALIESGVPLTTEGRLQAGQRVRVTSGALEGLEGVVLSRRGEDRLLVSVRFLQQGVSIQIKDYLLEPI
jgi:transcriptional antiterminator RfaH